MVTTEILKSVPLFANLADEQLRQLAAVATLRRFPRSTFIMRAGEETDGLYILLSGRAKVLIPDEEGHEVILAVMRPREFFGEMGLLDDQPRSASVETLEPCELVRVSKADFMRCLGSNMELAMRIIRNLVRRLREADRQIESLALMDVYGRVARVLLDLCEMIDGKRVILKAPPKQEIARMIGASREMVSRVMKDLQITGHIRCDKRRIVLTDKLPKTGRDLHALQRPSGAASAL
jgi:CRP/FNR family cyclic AMP-dependent transcriptional regulator